MTTIHCSVEDCPHRDKQTDTCRKADVIINAAGCAHQPQGGLNETDIKAITEITISIAQQTVLSQANVYFIAEMVAAEMKKSRLGVYA